MRCASGVLNELEELTQAVSFCGDHAIKFYAHSGRGPAASDNAAQCKSFDPDLSVRHPQADRYLRAGLDRGCCLDQTSTHAGIGEVSPDRCRNVIHPEFDRNEALDARMPPPIAAKIRTEDIWFEWRSCGRRRRNCFWFETACA